MDLVDKQHIVLLQRGEYAGQITRFVEHRSGSDLEAHTEFVGYDCRQCGLAQPGRTVQKQMVKSFAAHTGGCHKHFQIVHYAVLSGESLKLRWAQGFLDIAVAVGSRLSGGAYVEIFFQLAVGF